MNENESNIANLILHSQGADIGYRALQQLGDYKDRIKVLTLGAMTTIPPDKGSVVVNYKFKNDWISLLFASPFEVLTIVIDQQQRNLVLKSLPEGLLGCNHGIDQYLAEEGVRDYLRAFAKV